MACCLRNIQGERRFYFFKNEPKSCITKTNGKNLKKHFRLLTADMCKSLQFYIEERHAVIQFGYKTDRTI